MEIYRYLNYRDFLSDYVKAKEASSATFSKRQFARKAGISTGNYLAKVIRRERNLGPLQAERFIRAMALARAEADYFRAMIALERAETSESKAEFLERMETIRRRRAPAPLVEDGAFYRHWYTAVIFELASCRDFDAAPDAVSRALYGRITPSEARQTIDFLLERGYLEKDAAGRIRQREGVSVTSSQFVTNVFLRLSHKKMSLLAAEAVDLPLEERSFQGVSLALSRDQIPQVKERLREFAETLLQEFGAKNASPDADRVYRLSLQAFPVTRRPIRKG